MIGYLSGSILEKNDKYIIILVQGIGYKVFINTELIANTKNKDNLSLYIHTSVKEDDISLYGFAKKEELVFFEQLISISGIGSKMALEIISTPINITKQAIINEDIGLLTKIKGLGKKTAERMVLELKNKIDILSTGENHTNKVTYNEEAIEGLISLGYEKFQIIQVLSKAPNEIESTEDLIKYFLKQA